MPARFSLAVLLSTVLLSPAFVFAQAPAASTRITVVAGSDQRLRDDLEYLVKLAPANLQRHWKTLSETLESFEDGVDKTRPIGVEFIFGGEQLGYKPIIPFTELEGRGATFVNNVNGFGYKSAKDATGLWTLSPVVSRNKKAAAGPPPITMYMREAAGKYAVIAPDKAELPVKLADPSLSWAKFLAGARDAVAHMEGDPETMVARRKSFQELRKQLEAAIKFKRGESEADFALRKLSAEQSFNETERFLIDTKELLIAWTTDAEKNAGIGELLLTANPGTDLEASIQLLTQQPSYFANVPFHEKGTLQARINFAIDPMRSKHATDLYPVMLPSVKAWIDARPALDDKGKAAGKAAADVLFEMLTEAIALKNVDIFLDVHASADGKNTLVGGLRATDGTKAVDALKQFPNIRTGWKWEENKGEHAGVKLHALTVAPHRAAVVQALCGGDPVLHIGTSKDTVWVAAGQDAETELKAAIDAAQKPAPEKADPTFLHVDLRLHLLVDVLDAYRGSFAPGTTKQDQADDKQRAKWRKYGKDAFSGGDDQLIGKLIHEGNDVKGDFKVNLGALKFVGTMIADFVAENF